MRTTAVVLVLGSMLGGCMYYQDWRMKKTSADVNEQRARNMQAHRDCLQRYEGRSDAEQVCAPYAQAAR